MAVLHRAKDLAMTVLLFPVALVLLVPIVMGGLLLGSFSSIPGGEDE